MLLIICEYPGGIIHSYLLILINESVMENREVFVV